MATVESKQKDVEEVIFGSEVIPPLLMEISQNPALGSEPLLQNASSLVFSIYSPSVLSAWEQQAQVLLDTFITPGYLEEIGGCSFIQGDSLGTNRRTL